MLCLLSVGSAFLLSVFLILSPIGCSLRNCFVIVRYFYFTFGVFNNLSIVSRRQRYPLRLKLHELTFRGIKGRQTVSEMRKTLRNIFRLERSGSKLAYANYPFTFAQDYTHPTAKIKEIGD